MKGRRRRAKESVKKGEGRNGEKCVLQTTVRKIEGKTNRARGVYSGKEAGQKVGSDSGLRSENVRERYMEGRVEKEQGRKAEAHKEMKLDQNRKHRLVERVRVLWFMTTVKKHVCITLTVHPFVVLSL